MRRNVVLSIFNRITYLDQTEMLSNVLFVCAIYHASSHFYICVGACMCNPTPLLKGPVNESVF